jgi:hypothetical protein
MNYLFNTEHISQHIVKYGVDVRPAIQPDQEKAKLQDYGNWLIEQFPVVFETLLSGPKQLQIQGTFILADGKRAQFPTFILTTRGPVFTFPERLFIAQPHDIEIPDKNKIFRKALDELRTRFADRMVPRIGVVNEIVFDTGQFNSLDIIASNLRNEVWKEKIKNLRIILEVPTEGKNVNIEIRPTYLKPANRTTNLPAEDMKFGIIVNVDINNQQANDDLEKPMINDILAFASDYIPDELIRFLNNEY